MKNGKRPTVNQKVLLKQRGLIPDNWFVAKNLSREMLVVHRTTGTVRVVRK